MTGGDSILDSNSGADRQNYHQDFQATEELYRIVNDGKPVDLEEVEQLLSRGAAPCARVTEGHTTLSRAVQLLRPAWLILRLIRSIEHLGPRSGRKFNNIGINTVDSFGRTSLHYAAEAGDLTIVCLLIGAGCQLDTGDREHVTSLHLACGRGHQDVVVSLLRLGADVNVKTAPCYEKVTPLHIVASRGLTTIVKLLVDAGANIDCTDRKEQTPLFLAVAREHFETVRALLEFGAKPNWKQVNDYTPLFEAVTRNNKALVDLLLSHGASSHPSHYLLHQAIGRNFHDVALSLIKVGFSVYTTDRNGWSPLHLACQHGSVLLVQELIFRGADTDAAHPSSGVTPLIAAVKWLHSDDFAAIIQLLAAHGAHLDRSTKNGQTALKVALSERKLEFFTLLVAHGANVNRPEHGLADILGEMFANFGPEFLQLLWLAGLKFNQTHFECPGDAMQRALFIQTVLTCRNECLPLKAVCRLRIRQLEGEKTKEKGGGIFQMIESLPVPQALKVLYNSGNNDAH